MLFVNFLASVCFSIVLPSMWVLIQSVLHKTDTSLKDELTWTGVAVAANSAGTFVSSPVLGKWFDARGAREPLIVSLVVMIGGNVLYSLSSNIYELLASRFIVGIAAGNYVLAQTYLSYATTNEDRTKIMSYNSAATIFGFVFGPAFSAGLSFIPTIPSGAPNFCWYALVLAFVFSCH
jgi:MFS family permease